MGIVHYLLLGSRTKNLLKRLKKHNCLRSILVAGSGSQINCYTRTIFSARSRLNTGAPT